MSDTIEDILKEMRQSADYMERHHLYDLREWGTDNLRVLADRIEAANSRSYDLNRQILVLKRKKEMSDTYFCGYDTEEALVAQCSTCRFFKKKLSHCTLNDTLTNAKYKCSGWKFKTNKECTDEYKSELNREVEKLRKENARLRAALKPVLECKVISAMTVETGPGEGEYCAAIIEKAQRIYNEGEANQKE